MKIFVVIWIASVFVIDPCPDWKPDPYTGEYPNVMCSVNHGHYESKEMRREFKTKKEAEEFIENAPEEIKKTMKIVMLN